MKYKLSDICEYVRGKVSVSTLNTSTYISTENMLPSKGGIVEATTLPPAESTQVYLKDDILVSNIRPYFEKIWMANTDGGCSNDVLVFRAKPEINPIYLYYVLSDKQFFNYATATSKGTKMPRGDRSAIMEYEVRRHTRKEQDRMASILSSIDKKIELNNKINNNLYEQARLIFTQEFITRSELPKGWEKSNLLDIADYLNGLAMQKFRPNEGEKGLQVLKIKELRQGFCDSDSEHCSQNIKPEYKIFDGDVIFSWSGSLLVDFWCGGHCGLNQHLFKVTSRKYDPWFFFSWTNYHLDKFIAIAADKATTMGHIKRENLSEAEVIIPNAADYKRIGEVLSPLYTLIVENRIENKKLSNLRDLLLPRLMSGEINIGEITL